MLHPYRPHPWFAGRHRMTFYAWARRRTFPVLPPPEARYFTLSPVTKVLAHCHWQHDRRAHPTLLLLHGLEGSSDSHYMKGLAEKAFGAGFNAVRLNQRNCGGTDHLSEGLYHSGLADDPRTVLRELIDVDHLPALAVAGYSLGGNVALRLAGEDGADAPPQLKAVCSVSAPIELGICMDMMERMENRLYEWHFMLGLRERMRMKARLYPHLYDVRGLDGIWSVRAFDDRYTAPHHGFTGAADYYERASAMRVLERIRVPTLLITAEDDPFISPEPYRRPELAANPALTVVITPHGGHCGFVERPSAGNDGYWAEQAVVEFLKERLATGA
jgi:uncharacterized protein